MPGPSLVQTYGYAAPSTLERDGGRARLVLATSSAGVEPAERHPFFFAGELVAPRRAADGMLLVARVARTRFYVPPSMLARILAAADPVVTCTPDAVRFESFSACAGVYARFDIDASGVRTEHVSSGTTNVDFNPEMRALLAQTRATEEVRLSVGRDRVQIESARGGAVERQVPLPLRWVRSFGDVQAVLAGMTARLRVDGVEARRFLKGLPRSSARGASWIVRSGRGLRISQAAANESVRAGGLARLGALADVAGEASALVVHGDDTGSSAWELAFPDARFLLVLSPEAARGFSGEGRLLRDLAEESGRLGPAIAALRAQLHWQPRLEQDALARATGLDASLVRGALAALASRGLVGYDLAAGAYFHRALPFGAGIEALHPRLEGAKRLIDTSAVRDLRTEGGVTRARVAASGGGSYEVTVDAESFRCGCAWYGKHGTDRGPCKHALAVQLSSHGDEDDA